MSKNGKSMKYLVTFVLFISLISGSLVFGITRPPDYAGTSFQPGEQFFLTGSTIEFLGATQEQDHLRVELYHYAWTGEINGLSFTIRSVHKSDPTEVIPQMRYKGFYSILIPLNRSSGWELVRLDVTNFDKSHEKEVSEGNTKKIYVNEQTTEKKTDPFSTDPKAYAIRFYEDRIEKTEQKIQTQRQEISDLNTAIQDLNRANETIDENIPMLTESEKKYAENSKNGNLSKVSSNENAIHKLTQQIEEDELRIELMQAEIIFLQTGIRPEVDLQLEDLDEDPHELNPPETMTEPIPEVETDEAIKGATDADQSSDNDRLGEGDSPNVGLSEGGLEEQDPGPSDEISSPPVAPSPAPTPPPPVPTEPVDPPALPPENEPDDPPEFEFLP